MVFIVELLAFYKIREILKNFDRIWKIGETFRNQIQFTEISKFQIKIDGKEVVLFGIIVQQI